MRKWLPAIDLRSLVWSSFSSFAAGVLAAVVLQQATCCVDVEWACRSISFRPLVGGEEEEGEGERLPLEVASRLVP